MVIILQYLKGYSSDLLSHFHKVVDVKRIDKTDAAEAEITFNSEYGSYPSHNAT